MLLICLLTIYISRLSCSLTAVGTTFPYISLWTRMIIIRVSWNLSLCNCRNTEFFLKACNFLKKKHQNRSLSKKTAFLIEHRRRLLLNALFSSYTTWFWCFLLFLNKFFQLKLLNNYLLPSKYLLGQSQLRKHYKKMLNMFKINNERPRTKFFCLYCLFWKYFTTISSVNIVHSEQVSISLVAIGKRSFS